MRKEELEALEKTEEFKARVKELGRRPVLNTFTPNPKFFYKEEPKDDDVMRRESDDQ